MPANQGKDKGQAEVSCQGNRVIPDPFLWGRMVLGALRHLPAIGLDHDWIHCKEGNEIKRAKF